MNCKNIATISVLILALTGCTRLGAGDNQQFASTGHSVGKSTAAAVSATDIRDFIDPAAASQLTPKERTEAASAQFYALQFGRPGAPRNWQGDSGASGRVSVGPFVRVNTLDCREFTHSVSIAGKKFDHHGTACRETDGGWDVVDT